MPWVIRNSNGKYVAPAGPDKSFTPDIIKARRFDTKAEAERECCGNESAIDLRAAIGL